MEDILIGLNSAQREAVTHGEGPLLIIAGAGTGKTRVLTHRILHLIQTGAARSEQILALTFTEKATREMQERLDVLLPYGYTELWVKTFHGFCDSVLRERGLEIGLDTDYQLLPQADFVLFLKEHVFEFDLHYYRPLGSPLKFLNALADHFGNLRDERILPQTFLDYAEKQIKEAENQDPATQESAQKLLEVANAYAYYDKLVLKAGVLDFASLHFLTLQLFEQHPSVLKEYQERFKYILVDEFQDTNTAQNRLVGLLAQEHHNLMVVGDDDQCIYKWRGASLSNILHFEHNFPHSKKIVLTENYRSTQPLLDMSYAVIQNNNPFRLEIKENISKKLIAKSTSTDTEKPLLVHFSHYQDEAAFVIDRIQKTLKKDSAKTCADFAILVRASSHAAPFIEALNRVGLPYHFSGGQSLYSRPEIKDLMALLRSLTNPLDDIALLRVLSLSIFNFEPDSLLAFLVEAKKKALSLFEFLKKTKETPDLFTAGNDQAPLPSFFHLFSKLQSLLQKSQVSVILGTFLRESGYLDRLQAEESQENQEKIAALASFSNVIKQFEETHPSARILECLDYLDAREAIGDRSSGISEELADSNTVKVMTVHAAKGLEFDTVFLVDLVARRFPSGSRSDPFEIPETLLEDPLEDPSSHEHEERRLFYVAATRAKNHLFLTYSDHYEGKSTWKMSNFLKEALDAKTVTAIEASALPEPVAPLPPAPEQKPEFSDHSPLKLTRASAPLRFSYSQIDSYDRCPLQYKFRYLFKIAVPPAHSANFGTSVHHALNLFYRDFKTGKKPELVNLLALYEKHWIPSGYLNRTHHDARKQEGREILEQFFNTQQAVGWVIPELLEQPFTLGVGPQLLLTGRIDRIDRLADGTYEVIDYKTGELKDSVEKDLKNNLQLSIYALACDRVYHLPVSRYSLYFLKANQKISTTRDAKQLEKAQEKLVDFAETLKTSSFPAKPVPQICTYCDYRILCNKAKV
ncbi:MAG: UvrD-helicase domain-containing protein [Candidatus Gracilibacteria bacterium]